LSTGNSLWRQIDYPFLILLALLSGLGIAALWSASQGAGGGQAFYALRQLRWLMLGAGAMLLCSLFDYRHLYTYAYPIYGVLIILLLVVLFGGKTSMGAQRWISLGPIRMQPSEFVKIGIAITASRLFVQEGARPPYGLRELAFPIIVTLVPMGLVLMQPDLGTAILVGAVAFTIALFRGIKRKLLIWSGILMACAAPIFWSLLKEYQKARILTFLNPERDPSGAGYHIIQSKIAIGSGQFLGKGYLKGTQSHLRFLPERHTDFIFSVLAEEWGFLGSIGVLALFFVLILWGLDIAAKARDPFGRLLAVGVTSILFFHVMVNIAMVMGLLPVVGVPLPLFSYGGSSVLTTYLIAGILMSIRIRRFSR